MRQSWMLGAGLLMILGCQPSITTTVPVSGKVTYRGAPLPAGTIVFSPDTSKGEHGRIAFGTIKSDGSYVLFTEGAHGAAAGWYRITITSLAGPSAFSPSYLPDKFRDPDLSGLVCEVKADHANAINFPLE